MLRSLRSLLGSPVLAKDGEIGDVCDVLFHDRSWLVRYLVVNTGTWLSGRRVLLSPIVAHAPELERKVLRVDLTREQVQTSPGIGTHLPVSRQEEIAMNLQYGWPVHWADSISGSQGAPAADADPHLRSATEVLEYAVKTSDGDLGHMADLIMEDANWFIRFLVVGTGNWFEGQKLLIGTGSVGSVSWLEQELHLPHSRDAL